MTILTNKRLMISFSSIVRLLSHVPAQERIKGTEKASPIHTLFHR